MRSNRWRALAVVTTLVALVTVSRIAAREQAAPATDVLPQLLTEVRGLRAAMEQMAASGPRVQLALGRLQLQEQRVNTLLRRLDEIRTELNQAQSEQEMQQQQMKVFGAAIEKADSPDREQAGQMADHFKAALAAVAKRVQRLQDDEMATSQMLGAEQARWGDINRSVQELERSLDRR